MKKIIAAGMIAGILLTGCGNSQPVETAARESAPTVKVIPMETLPVTETQPAEITLPAETQQPLPPETTAETVALAPEAYQVVYSCMIEDNQEYYTFQGIGPQKDIVWNLETRHLDCGQVPRITPIGSLDGRFFYAEDGTVIALNTATGETLWENPEFGGCIPNNDCMLLDPSGFIYLSGFEGPDLCVLDVEGNLISKTDCFCPEAYHPVKLWIDGSQLTVHLESDSPEGKTFSVDMSWIPQTQG